MNTKDNLLKSLREKPRTISELAGELGITRNAIKLQVDQLMASGTIEKGTLRRAATAGKPAQEYKVAPGTEDNSSTAYVPFIQSLLETLPDHLDRKQRKKLLETVGRHMARQVGFSGNGTLEAKLKEAIAVVNSLGATATLIDDGNEIWVKNMSCPLASAVRKEPCVCDAVAAFFTEATNTKVKADCCHGEMLICQYRVEGAKK